MEDLQETQTQTEMPKTIEVFDLMGRIVAGLQVPVSMGVPLGEAESAWRELWAKLPGLGWRSAEEVGKEIRELVGTELIAALQEMWSKPLD